MAIYTTGEMAEKLYVTQKTLQNWDKSGKLVANRTPTGRRFYTHQQYLEVSGQKKYVSTGSDLDYLADKTILLTGGSGSLGNKFVEIVAPYAKKIIVFSRCELKQYNMRQKFKDKDNIRYFLGDVKDKARLNLAFKNVDLVVHMACYKRIEVCSADPIQSIQNNIFGSVCVLEAAIENNIKKCVLISTDKAVNSCSIYGSGKSTVEHLFISGNNYSTRDSTIFSVVRYGNVFGSNGSIRHIFEKQAKENGKIEITDPNMDRFFMSLDDSVFLVLYCLNHSLGGEIIIPKMKSCKIERLAKLFYPNTPIVITGLRGPEKIHEELISETESNYVVDCGKYYKIIPQNVRIPGLGWDRNYPDEKKIKPFKYSSDLVEQFTDEELIKLEENYSGNKNL